MKTAIASIIMMFTVVGISGTAEAQAKGAPAKPAIYAQKLVDEALTEHPDVVIIAMHVTPPNQTENVIIASNIGRIGKKADEDDMNVINTGKSNLEVNKMGNHFEDEVTLQDQSGKTIGAVGIVFNYKPGDDKSKYVKVAEQIRDEWKAKIPNKEKLFEPTN
jgi:hypothetical protein